MKNLTAVEWFWNEIAEVLPFTVDSTTAIKMYDKLQQAKAMEKEQIEDAYGHGQNNGYMYANQKAITIRKDQYYNETYGKDSKPLVESFCYHKGTYTTIKDSNGNEVCGKCRLPIAEEDKQ